MHKTGRKRMVQNIGLYHKAGNKKLSCSTVVISFTRYLFLSVIVLVSIIPLVWIILSSFKTNAEILGSGISLPSHWNFDGYIAAFKMAPLYLYFGNSLFIALTSTVINVFLIAMGAYAIARFKFKFRNLIVIILSTAMMLPMTALINPVYIVIKSMGLYNTKAGLILVYTALGLPMSLLILRSTFLTIPKSLEEAAYIDGLGFFRTFIQIALPISKGGLACAAVIQFLTAWNEFIYALVLTSSESCRTLPLSLSYFTSQFSFNYTAMFAAITVSVIPSIIIFAIFQEQVIGSFTAGAVKE